MTYTGAPQIVFARDLVAAASGRQDIWLRGEAGDEALILGAARKGNTVTVTLDPCNWPKSVSTVTRHIGADERISTRVY